MLKACKGKGSLKLHKFAYIGKHKSGSSFHFRRGSCYTWPDQALVL